MRILLVSPYFPPLNAVAARRTYSFARTWADAGHEITVLTTLKRDDQRTLPRDVGDMRVQEIAFRVPAPLSHMRRWGRSTSPAASGSTSVPSVPTMTSMPNMPNMPNKSTESSPTSLRGRLRGWGESRGVMSSVRMPDLTDFWVKPAVEWARGCVASDGPWDVVVSSSGPYTAHLVAMAVRQSGGARQWAADFRDLWTDNHARPGLFPFTIRERLLEDQVLRSAGLVTTVSAGLARTLRSKTAAPVEIVYNGFDEALNLGKSDDRIFPRDDVHRLVYTGTWYPKGQRVEPLFEAWARLKDAAPEVAMSIRLVVAGRDTPAWHRIARGCGLGDQLDAFGEVSQDDALRMQRDADALLLVDWFRAADGVLTGKVFEYLQHTAPILVIAGEPDSPVGTLVERAGRGRHYGQDIDAIAGALRALVTSPATLRRDPDVTFIATLDRTHQAERMLTALERLHTPEGDDDPGDQHRA